jgi:hypothetical protein
VRFGVAGAMDWSCRCWAWACFGRCVVPSPRTVRANSFLTSWSAWYERAWARYRGMYPDVDAPEPVIGGG